MIRTKNDAEKYIDALPGGEGVEFMDWENGELLRLREHKGHYLLEDANISERFQPKEKAINFAWKHRKQFNKLF